MLSGEGESKREEREGEKILGRLGFAGLAFLSTPGAAGAAETVSGVDAVGRGRDRAREQCEEGDREASKW